ncbi:hypothetical protein BR93DRAFT_302811 [Coniochaeta sp. PMI_546]|nr:hypothetical protein BR93DRAFT_302811 [Coniochaeta sp. PMI_546]
MRTGLPLTNFRCLHSSILSSLTKYSQPVSEIKRTAFSSKMHHSQALVAVLSVLVSHGSARYISTEKFSIFDPPKPTQAQRMVHLPVDPSNKNVLPEGCAPVTPCHHPPPVVAGDTASKADQDNIEVSCTPRMLKCTGPQWETPDNKAFLLPWQADLVPNVVYKAGPFTSFHVPEAGATYAAKEELSTRWDENEKTVDVFGGSNAAISLKPTAVVDRRDQGQETVHAHGFGPTRIKVARQAPKEEHFVIEATYVTDDKNRPIIPTVAPRSQTQEHFVIEVSYATDDKRSLIIPTVAPRSHTQEHFVIEVSYATNDKNRPIIPTVAPRSQTQEHFVIEVSYATNDKRSTATPTVAPEHPRAGKINHHVVVVPGAAKGNIVIPTDTPEASINPNAGRLNPTALGQDPQTTMKRLRRRRLV